MWQAAPENGPGFMGQTPHTQSRDIVVDQGGGLGGIEALVHVPTGLPGRHGGALQIIRGRQVVEVEDVGVHQIGRRHQVAHDPGVGRGRHPAGRVQGHDRGQAVGYGTDPADALGEVLGVKRMPVLENIFKTAKQGAGGLGVDDLLHAVLCFDGNFDLEMSL